MKATFELSVFDAETICREHFANTHYADVSVKIAVPAVPPPNSIYVNNGCLAITDGYLGFTPAQIRIIAGHSGENKIKTIKMMRETYDGMPLAASKRFVEHCMNQEWDGDSEMVKYFDLKSWALENGFGWMVK